MSGLISMLRAGALLGVACIVSCGGSEPSDDPSAGGSSSAGAPVAGAAGKSASGGSATAGAAVGGSSGGAAGSAVMPGGAPSGGTPSFAGSTGTGGSSGSTVGGTSSGGTGSGGAPSGGKGPAGGMPAQAGAAAGGTPGAGGRGGSAGSGTGGASGAPGNYPCDGTTTGYDTLMIKSGTTWTVTNGARQVYSGADMEAALRAAYGSLTSGRTSKQKILVQGSGDIPASSQVAIPSYTVLNVCGTINVSGTASGSDRSPLYARNARDIEIPNLKMTGSPQYGIFVRQTDNVHLGNIDLRLTASAGIGIRADNGPNSGSTTTFNQNLRIDRVYGAGMGSHVVETYGISNIQIGTVEGNGVGECGLLFNRSINATVDLVSCTDCATGTGYAAFRMANRNGAVNGNWNTANVIVKSVVARGGGRGIFCVSESGAARIDHVDIQNTGNNSILLENCYNVTVGSAAQQSRIASSGELRIAARSEFANGRDLTFQNIAVSGTPIAENPCATNSTWTNVNGAPTNCN